MGVEDTLSAPIKTIKGVGPKTAQLLAKKGIASVEDALYFLPRGYEDRRQITPIRSLVQGMTATVLADVTSTRQIKAGRQMRFEATVSDGTGFLRLVWFRAYPSLAADFGEGRKLVIFGEVAFFGSVAQMAHPDYEPASFNEEGKPVASVHFGRVVPLYSETEGLHQKAIRRLMGEVLRVSLPVVEEPLPDGLLQRHGLPKLRESLLQLHFPKEVPEPDGASGPLKRLAFEEFFVLQLGLELRHRARMQEKALALEDKHGFVEAFLAQLPFQLTDDQKNAWAAIRSDLAKPWAMTRLVQGDVGAGKTVVALAAAALAASAGVQTAFMAPTEVLAQQHYALAAPLFKKLGVETVFISQGSLSDPTHREKLGDGGAALAIGTHALFQQSVEFQRLGLVIVDEQHRFGVEQRETLLRKAQGYSPHLLLMTATPIPRTLALTCYGDLDLTLIQQKPKGRQPIRTRIVGERGRAQLYSSMRSRFAEEEQAYVIYPLIEASEKLDLKSATEMHERLSREIFPGQAVGLLHGRMKADEKERILTSFKRGEIRLLVSTTVIEVGIDVPNATMMVIEHAERLGLSQLHQLRGRVGRGSKASECVLVSEAVGARRLRILAETEDGFRIAEEDLKLRGPGEFMGTRQSGLPGFRVGDLIRDEALLLQARNEALNLLGTDPELRAPEHQGIRTLLQTRWGRKIEKLRGA